MENLMGKDSAIGWTHHTFNTHWGCEKVSPACDNCYAEAMSKLSRSGSPSYLFPNARIRPHQSLM